MEKLRVAIVGYGSIGKYALEALLKAPDMECAGVVRRSGNAEGFPELSGVRVVKDPGELGRVDVAILAVPSRSVGEIAAKYLERGINTVDSFDIHAEIRNLRPMLDAVAKDHDCVSIISAGWDPGSDSVVRALMMALCPDGVSYTNFGPGRSMGHTVAAKAIPGVKDALSMTLPQGKGIHKRHVYVELESGADFDEVASAIRNDPYFRNDETEVEEVESVAAIDTHSHGVNLVRTGSSGTTQGQSLEFNMKINNPALTGQMLVGAARAACRQKKGCYTMIEIPPVDFLPGDRADLINILV